MPSLFLTAENIRILKAELARVLPDIKSSHRIEALASAVGFRTYAALLASQQGTDRFRPLFLSLDATRFSARLHSWGYHYGPEMFGHLVHLSDLVDRPRVVVPRDNSFAIDRWFRDCQQRGVPTMYIVPAANMPGWNATALPLIRMRNSMSGIAKAMRSAVRCSRSSRAWRKAQVGHSMTQATLSGISTGCCLILRFYQVSVCRPSRNPDTGDRRTIGWGSIGKVPVPPRHIVGQTPPQNRATAFTIHVLASCTYT